MLTTLLSLTMALAVPLAAAEFKPLTLAVVDDGSGAPVDAYSYQAWYDAPGLEDRPDQNKWTDVASPSGSVEIQAPTSCRLHVDVRAPDYIGGSAPSDEFIIRSSDSTRRIVIRLRRGITVSGTIRDSETKKPIAGAVVAPNVPYSFFWGPDEHKQVRTGADGRYQLRGVDPKLGIDVEHDAYIHQHGGMQNDKPIGPIHDILLEPEPRFEVTAVDPSGKPLEGVRTDDRMNEQAVSGKDGKLVLVGPVIYFGLTFRKEGFIDATIPVKKVGNTREKPEGLVVVMEPAVVLAGRVLAPDGRPVPSFTIAAGPGKLPARRDCAQRDVQSRDGRFQLHLPKEGTTWLGVSADGFAVWEGSVDFKRGGEPVEVRLAPGVAVTARVLGPQAVRDRVEAKLVPRRDKTGIGGLPAEPPSEELAIRRTRPSADGTLRFEHVRPDRYRLFLEGRGNPHRVLALDVPGHGLDVGTVHLDVPTATGRIEGRVWRPKYMEEGPWAFTKGYVGAFRFEAIPGIDEGESIEFRADENGRFAVDNVPVGLTTVGFSYAMADVIHTDTWQVRVVEGQTTEVRAHDPARPHRLALAFAIGDGSKAQYESGTGLGAARGVDNVTLTSSFFAEIEKRERRPLEPSFRVALTPLSQGTLSFEEPNWADLDAERNLVLPDVGAGRYRLRVYDWLGSTDLESEPLFDREVVVPPDGRGQVEIALGAGCITGKIPPLKENFKRPVVVTAVAKGGRERTRQARCDDGGNFCVRYLSPGSYSLFIHDPKSGFCRVDDVQVPAGAVDIGERVLTPGATIRGAISFVRPTRVPDEVVATHSTGASVRLAFEVYSSFDRFEIAGFWPGRWRVSARGGEERLGVSEVNVDGTGLFPVDLTAGETP